LVLRPLMGKYTLDFQYLAVVLEWLADVADPCLVSDG